MHTTEAVSRGHPDKFCDQVSDKITALILHKTINEGIQNKGKAAIEVLAKGKTIVVAGEYWLPNNNILTEKEIKLCIDQVIADVYGEGLEYNFINLLETQSSEINNAVASNSNIKAGDQGVVYGYAVNEYNYLPCSYYWCQKLMVKYAEFIKINTNYKADAKCQISTKKNGNIHKILLSAQHKEGLNESKINKDLKDFIYSSIPSLQHKNIYNVMVNPSKSFTQGGFEADCGLTGRKLMVDTYGGLAKHGGGAFSGKDFTKVDRSGAYIARALAKSIVKQGYARECEVRLSYAIGRAEPFDVKVNTFGTSTKKVEAKLFYILYSMNITPNFMFKTLKLFDNPEQVYLSSQNGHFTNQDFNWEKININL